METVACGAEILDRLDLLISFFSLLSTTVLTILIIHQTHNLAKQQTELEQHLNKQQLEMQKRQIRLESFSYKIEIYKALHNAFQFTGEVESLYNTIDIYKKNYDQLYPLFSSLLENMNKSTTDTLWLFKQAEFIISPNIYSAIKDISFHFDQLSGSIAKLKLYPLILLEDEMETEKKKVLDCILHHAEKINTYVLYINSVMPHEISINQLEK